MRRLILVALLAGACRAPPSAPEPPAPPPPSLDAVCAGPLALAASFPVGRKVVLDAPDRRLVQWTTGNALIVAEFSRQGDRCAVAVSRWGE